MHVVNKIATNCHLGSLFFMKLTMCTSSPDCPVITMIQVHVYSMCNIFMTGIYFLNRQLYVLYIKHSILKLIALLNSVYKTPYPCRKLY